jgi:mevalonate kinase
VYTGKPQSSTKEAVEKARVYFEKYGIEKYIDVYNEIKTSVLDDNAEQFSDALRKNQQLLSDTGVSSEYADALAKKVESAGGALKITGAGTAHGKEVGMMLGYHPHREKLEKMFKNEGLTSFYISCNVPGVMG